MPENLNVHLMYDYGEVFIAQLKDKLAGNIKLTVGKTSPDPAEYQILIGGVPDKELLEASPDLHSLIIPWAGFPKVTRELMVHYPQIKIHNIHHNASTTAEMAVTLMMTAMKRIIPVDRDFRQSDWRRRYGDEPILSLEGRTVVVVGYGNIGKRIGEMCRSFGMKVIGIKKNVEEEADNIFSIDKLRTYLPIADVLMLSVPLTDETSELIGADELALLPDNATLVNISRGEVVNEKALFLELKSNRIRAGIDVWYNYPKGEDERIYTSPSKYAFFDLDNVVMTPHLAGHSTVIENLRIDALAELLNYAAEGNDMPNKIDVNSGY